jgi:hypothetical protein
MGGYRRGWEVNIQMHVRKIGLEIVDCMRLAEVRDRWHSSVNTVISLLVA